MTWLQRLIAHAGPGAMPGGAKREAEAIAKPHIKIWMGRLPKNALWICGLPGASLGECGVGRTPEAAYTAWRDQGRLYALIRATEVTYRGRWS